VAIQEEKEKLPRSTQVVNRVTRHSHCPRHAAGRDRSRMRLILFGEALSTASIHATFLYLPCPGGGMADAEDLKSRQGIQQRYAPKRNKAKIACIYAASGDSFDAVPGIAAKQNEKPTDTRTDTALRCKGTLRDGHRPGGGRPRGLSQGTPVVPSRVLGRTCPVTRLHRH
jgi:hypothetical protein